MGATMAQGDATDRALDRLADALIRVNDQCSSMRQAIGALDAGMALSHTERGRLTELMQGVAQTVVRTESDMQPLVRMVEEHDKTLLAMNQLLVPLVTKFEAQKETVEDHEYRINALERARQRGKGALWVAGTIGTLLATGVGLFWTLADKLGWLPKH
jgi:hypothetical protein